MIAILVVVMVLLAVLSVTLASVEAAFYLVKRRRLSHLEQNPRAELVNRYDDPAYASVRSDLTALLDDVMNHDVRKEPVVGLVA